MVCGLVSSVVVVSAYWIMVGCFSRNVSEGGFCTMAAMMCEELQLINLQKKKEVILIDQWICIKNKIASIDSHLI